jgi:hypothetical protein
MKNYFNNINNLTQLSDNTCDPKLKKNNSKWNKYKIIIKINLMHLIEIEQQN